MRNEIFPPMQYELMWAILTGGLILVCVLFFVFLFIMTRKVKDNKDVTPLPRGISQEEALSLIKNKYAKNITLIHDDYKNGEITVKKAFQSLSVELRNFTHEFSSTGAYAMTLNDLEKNNAPLFLREKIEDFYPFAFEKAEKDGNVDLAVSDALEVIKLWK